MMHVIWAEADLVDEEEEVGEEEKEVEVGARDEEREGEVERAAARTERDERISVRDSPIRKSRATVVHNGTGGKSEEKAAYSPSVSLPDWRSCSSSAAALAWRKLAFSAGKKEGQRVEEEVENRCCPPTPSTVRLRCCSIPAVLPPVSVPSPALHHLPGLARPEVLLISSRSGESRERVGALGGLQRTVGGYREVVGSGREGVEV